MADADISDAASPFTAQTRISGLVIGGRELRKRAVDPVLERVGIPAGSGPADFRAAVDRIARTSGTPLAVSERSRLLGVVHLEDMVKPDTRRRFAPVARHGHPHRHVAVAPPPIPPWQAVSSPRSVALHAVASRPASPW